MFNEEMATKVEMKMDKDEIDIPDLDEAVEKEYSERIHVRISKENKKFMQGKSKRYATSLSSLASIAIAEWCDEEREKELRYEQLLEQKSKQKQ